MSFLLAAACTRGATLEAKVGTMPSRAPDGAYVAGRPLGGAHIALDCDGGALAKNFESDAQGRVSAQGVSLSARLLPEGAP